MTTTTRPVYRTADDYFAAYGTHHQNPINKAFHWVCVPLIVLSLLGLLWEVQPLPQYPWANLAVATVVLAQVFYLRLSVPLGLGMLVYSGLSMVLLYRLDLLGYPIWLISLGVFLAAWIGQFIGHKIEGAKPSFLEDLKFLLIGPIWLLGFAYRRWGIRY